MPALVAGFFVRSTYDHEQHRFSTALVFILKSHNENYVNFNNRHCPETLPLPSPTLFCYVLSVNMAYGHDFPGIHNMNLRFVMKRVFFTWIAVALYIAVLPCHVAAEDNSTPGIMAKPAQEQPKPASGNDAKKSSLTMGKLPVDIQSKGSDQSGTLLSYKLKEELISSKLFELTAADKKKFVLHVFTQPEFPERPSIASQYSVVAVYQEDPSTLTYYLDHYQGQVHSEGVSAEMQKILEWTYATIKRYRYLLDE